MGDVDPLGSPEDGGFWGLDQRSARCLWREQKWKVRGVENVKLGDTYFDPYIESS